MQVFSERLPIKSFKQDVSALREFCKGKDKVLVTSILAPGTCAEIPNISYEFNLEGQEFSAEFNRVATVVMKPESLEKTRINTLSTKLISKITLKGLIPDYNYEATQIEVDALLIAIGQAGSNPIVKLLTDAYCLHRFYSGEKEI